MTSVPGQSTDFTDTVHPCQTGDPSLGGWVRVVGGGPGSSSTKSRDRIGVGYLYLGSQWFQKLSLVFRFSNTLQRGTNLKLLIKYKNFFFFLSHRVFG